MLGRWFWVDVLGRTMGELEPLLFVWFLKKVRSPDSPAECGLDTLGNSIASLSLLITTCKMRNVVSSSQHCGHEHMVSQEG